MKKLKILSVVLLVGTVMTLTLNGCTKETDQNVAAVSNELKADPAVMAVVADEDVASACRFDSIPLGELSTDEINALQWVREEEFLAHDVYLTLSGLYTKPIFRNIARSELVHTSAVKTLLDRYQIEDPAANHVKGVFSQPDLQALYDQLVAAGSASLLDGLVVGATIEDLDIADLEAKISITDNEDILQVFNNLMKGSRNHLRSFFSSIVAMGGSYTPQYISQEEFDAIIQSPYEFGRY